MVEFICHDFIICIFSSVNIFNQFHEYIIALILFDSISGHIHLSKDGTYLGVNLNVKIILGYLLEYLLVYKSIQLSCEFVSNLAMRYFTLWGFLKTLCVTFLCVENNTISVTFCIYKNTDTFRLIFICKKQCTLSYVYIYK